MLLFGRAGSGSFAKVPGLDLLAFEYASLLVQSVARICFHGLWRQVHDQSVLLLGKVVLLEYFLRKVIDRFSVAV